MKAAAIRSFGGPEVVELLDVATPAAGPGEVRVRMRAAGVQPADCAVRGGWAPPGQELSFPQKIGNEFAGVVDQVGEGAAGFPVGSEVLGWALLAAHAEYVVVPTDQIVPKPAAMPWPVAGVLSASGQTAHTALERLKVGAGDTLLVHAAAGGVGTVAVQLHIEIAGTYPLAEAAEAHRAVETRRVRGRSPWWPADLVGVVPHRSAGVRHHRGVSCRPRGRRSGRGSRPGRR
ncbi:alcohol dehydrogenase catalytic domain-containing protein [Streptomyces sp. CA-132043]|uniref:alcohol dehydrogenase catalytic domain-containing protein n=1 Tax=Streptomyces sp. CA-132043 TaxID=3240048 RepID=UPI003D8A61D2